MSQLYFVTYFNTASYLVQVLIFYFKKNKFCCCCFSCLFVVMVLDFGKDKHRCDNIVKIIRPFFI